MKILLLKNCHSPEYLEIVKENGKNVVFESYKEMDEWIYDMNLDPDSFTPILIEENKIDFETIFRGRSF